MPRRDVATADEPDSGPVVVLTPGAVATVARRDRHPLMVRQIARGGLRRHLTTATYAREMTTESVPPGPEPEAIIRTILERFPDTDVVAAFNAWFFSIDPETHWPNFAT